MHCFENVLNEWPFLYFDWNYISLFSLKRIPAEEYNEQIRYQTKIDTSGPPAKAVESDAGYNEEQTTFRWRWRQRQKQRLRERRRQRQRQEERRKLQQLRHGVPLRPHSFSGTSGRWRENRRVDRPHSYGSDVVYFPPNSPFPNLSNIRQKRKKHRKPFVSSFPEASPNQPYQLQQENTGNCSSEKIEAWCQP